MEIRTAAVYGIFVMMCVNVASLMMKNVGIEGLPIDPYNHTQVDDPLNTTQPLDTWTHQDTTFYDISAGIINFWYRNIPFIEGFGAMLQAYGCPQFIYRPLHDIWRFMLFTFTFLFYIGGRNV